MADEPQPEVPQKESAPHGSRRQSKTNPIASAARYSEIGFVIPASIFLGYGLGRLADYWLHTRWFYLAGVIFGAVVGFVQMIRMASALSSDKTDS